MIHRGTIHILCILLLGWGLPGCVSKGDDDDDAFIADTGTELYTASDESGDDDGGGDGGDGDDDGSSGDDDDSGEDYDDESYPYEDEESLWTGRRRVDIYSVDGGGLLCSAWWETTGEASSLDCEGCSFVFDIYATPAPEGTCEGATWDYSLGYAPSWYYSGYGPYEVVLLYYSGEWHFYGYATWSGSYLSYQMNFYGSLYYYESYSYAHVEL